MNDEINKITEEILAVVDSYTLTHNFNTKKLFLETEIEYKESKINVILSRKDEMLFEMTLRFISTDNVYLRHYLLPFTHTIFHASSCVKRFLTEIISSTND